MLATEFETLHQLAPERIRVIYNGVDIDRFNPSNRDRFRELTRRQLGVTDQVLFLMLAHNLLLKNAEVVVRAAATLVTDGANIQVVIGGGRKPRFDTLVKRLGLDQVVRFVGLVDSLPLYAAADVYVQPTWYDPCSLVTLEASSCGLPVITSRFNGAAELMSDGSEGFVVDDPGNVAAVAACMGKLLDTALRDSMGTASRAFALKHTFENQTDEFVTLYREIARADRRR
jgi:UDP-glucose:(heptosyl)LPS alpha-1,3-glucosyltransferase